jgi:hypothetical protein
MHKIYEYLCDELKDLEKKAESGQQLSMAELEYLNKLTETKKNLLKIEMLEEDSEYSNAMGRGGNRGGGRRNSYYSMDDGMGIRGGSYARGRGRNARRDAMGRYSSEGGYSRAEDDFRADLEELMAMAPNDQIRQKMQRIMSDM